MKKLIVNVEVTDDNPRKWLSEVINSITKKLQILIILVLHCLKNILANINFYIPEMRI